MSYHTDDLELASPFQPVEGEANFGPTLTKEVVGGTHIAPHCITIRGDEYVLVDWAEGLPRHDKPGNRAVRFPHGLILFGETFEECARRLVAKQLGMEVESVRICHIYSQLDETNHWHLEPLLLTQVSGEPQPPQGAKAVLSPIGPKLPEGGVWRDKPPFEEAFEKYLAVHL